MSPAALRESAQLISTNPIESSLATLRCLPLRHPRTDCLTGVALHAKPAQPMGSETAVGGAVLAGNLIRGGAKLGNVWVSVEVGLLAEICAADLDSSRVGKPQDGGMPGRIQWGADG